MNKPIVSALIWFAVLIAVYTLLSLFHVPSLLKVSIAGGIAAFVGLRLIATAGNRAGVRVEKSEQARLLDQPPPPDKVVLLVYREGFVGSRAGVDVAVDGRTVTQLRSPACTRVLVSAGPHRLSASLNRQIANDGPGFFDFQALSGETVIVKLIMGAAGSLSFQPEPDPIGARSRLAKMPMMQPDLAEI